MAIPTNCCGKLLAPFIIIFGYIWLITTIIIGFLGCLIARVLCLGDQKANLVKEFVIGRVLINVLRCLCVYSFELQGYEKLHGDEQFVLVANHQSTLDNAMMTFLPAASPTGEKKYLTKSMYFALPIFGWAQKLSGDIGVDLKDEQSRAESISKCCDALDRGSSLVVYPEGGRNQRLLQTGQLLPFKNGAFRIAQHAKRRVLPVCLYGSLDGMGTACRCDTLLSIGPAKLIVRVCEPFKIADPTGDAAVDAAAVKEAAERARASIQEAYTELEAQHGAYLVEARRQRDPEAAPLLH
eukprot:TRINITY_DN9990_c0_g1_i1.p1 TRINITY_DN9990_c0_g1~~TRINITY_DN9990_c0_g1_i1.p1  ORF type:complete len:320 (+),score=95.44 TRINITY_DN9990_c0_g1_i1:74-961(+)